ARKERSQPKATMPGPAAAEPASAFLSPEAAAGAPLAAVVPAGAEVVAVVPPAGGGPMAWFNRTFETPQKRMIALGAGGGGLFVVILLIVLLAGGKPSPAEILRRLEAA